MGGNRYEETPQDREESRSTRLHVAMVLCDPLSSRFSVLKNHISPHNQEGTHLL